MVAITSQKAAAGLSEIDFCYLCEEEFCVDSDRDDDHVPPTTLFEAEDRDFPIILPTHVACNNAESQDDQKIGNLFRILRGSRYEPRRGVLPLREIPDVGPTAHALDEFDLPAIVRRWIRGFHAALYREPIANDVIRFSTTVPFPKGTRDGLKIEPLPEVYSLFVEELKRNRTTDSIDRIVCRNGKCRYECVWSRSDSGPWMCIYALDLYGWIDAAPFEHMERRGCVGAYLRHEGSRPGEASAATSLDFAVINEDPNDPFGP